MDEPSRQDLIRDILIWQGVVNQLMTTRANQLLADTELTLPQFTVLNHFQRPERAGQTVSELARAFQANQPGMTKTVKLLADKGFLRVEADDTDKRLRRLYLTDAGRAAHASAIRRMAPDAAMIFEDWSDADLMALRGGLDRFKTWLDANRDRLVVAG